VSTDNASVSTTSPNRGRALRVFLSYRRADTSGHAGRLYDALARRYGAENVFMDIDSLRPGDDFRAAIDETLSQCDVVFVLVGPRWMGPGRRGQRRINEDDDFVRMEVERALSSGKQVVPLLVGGASLPRPQDLPESLHPLLTRHAVHLTDTQWPATVARLFDGLEASGPTDSTNGERRAPELVDQYAPAAQFPAALGVLRERPFVGRGDELGALEQCWQQVRDGRGAFVALTGEPGIGKTRLAAAFAARVHDADGTNVLFGRCDEEALRVLQPVAEALDAYLHGISGDHASAALPPFAAGLAPIVTTAPGRPTTGRSQSDPVGLGDERAALLDAIGSFVTALAARAPLLFVVDDVHWATEPTMTALRHIARSSLQLPVMILATYRDGDLAPSSPLGRTLLDLDREGMTPTRLRLSGLGKMDVAALTDDVDVAERLYDQTRGNPFFVEQLVRALQRGANESQLPEEITDAIRDRCAQVDDATARMLRVAAVVGQSFTMRLLERIPEAAERSDDLVDALDTAMKRGLVVQQPTAGADALGFEHALVRRALYDDMTPVRRSRLHLAVARALEDQPDRSDAALKALAHHYTEAAVTGAVDKAVTYSVAAAEAIASVAAEEAVTIIRRALAVIANEPNSKASRADLLTLLHYPLRLLERWAEARAACLGAIDLARAVDDAERLARAVDAFSRCRELGKPEPQLGPLVDEALKALDDRAPSLRGRLLIVRADEITAQGGDWSKTWPVLQAATRLARDGDVVDRYEVLWRALRLVWGSSLFVEQRELLDEFRDVERNLPGHLGEHEIHLIFDARLKLELGDPDFATSLQRWTGALAGVREPNIAGWRDYASAAFNLMRGEFDEAQALIEAILSRSQESNDRSTIALAQLFLLQRERGQLHDILPVAQQAIAENPGLAGFRAALGLGNSDIGRSDAAQQEFDALCADGFASVPRDMTWTGSLSILAELCATLRDARRAEALRDLLAPYAGHVVVIADFALVLGAADRGLGQLAATLERWDEAERHYQRALETEQRLGAASLVARTRYWYARALVERGRPEDRARARAELGTAKAAADAMTMAGLGNQVDTLHAFL
jgi:tetratricopeptide (TPR) repeat protein